MGEHADEQRAASSGRKKETDHTDNAIDDSEDVGIADFGQFADQGDSRTALPCGLDEFEGVGANATFGDGKTFFVARCSAMYNSEVCEAAASLIWEKEDLHAAFVAVEGSDFCTELASAVGRSRPKPEVSSLLDKAYSEKG